MPNVFVDKTILLFYFKSMAIELYYCYNVLNLHHNNNNNNNNNYYYY